MWAYENYGSLAENPWRHIGDFDKINIILIWEDDALAAMLKL